MPDKKKNWKDVYLQFSSDENIKLIVSQENIPSLDSDEEIELLFNVLQDKSNRHGKIKDLAETWGTTLKRTTFIVSALRNATDGHNWSGEIDPNNIQRKGGKLER